MEIGCGRRIERIQQRRFAGAMTWHAFRLTAFCQILDEWRCRALSRRGIAELDHRVIRDLGISPSQMRFEAAKPFWRA
jgi:uncharacterized protein YjiS (DUF1127 family)